MSKNGTKEVIETAVQEHAETAVITIDYLRQERQRLDGIKQQLAAELNATIGAMSWIEREIARMEKENEVNYGNE